jgi:hypothetical protein
VLMEQPPRSTASDVHGRLSIRCMLAQEWARLLEAQGRVLAASLVIGIRKLLPVVVADDKGCVDVLDCYRGATKSEIRGSCA